MMCNQNECKFYEKETNSCMGQCETLSKVYVILGTETIGLCTVDGNKQTTMLGVYPTEIFDCDGLEVSVINYYGLETFGDDFDEESPEIQYLYDNATIVTDEEFTEIVS